MVVLVMGSEPGGWLWFALLGRGRLIARILRSFRHLLDHSVTTCRDERSRQKASSLVGVPLSSDQITLLQSALIATRALERAPTFNRASLIQECETRQISTRSVTHPVDTPCISGRECQLSRLPAVDSEPAPSSR